MAEITKELGRIPVSRGDYQSTTEYYKDNIVQYKRSSYQVVSESPIVGVPPTNDKNIVNPGWTLFAGTLDAQDVVNQIKEQETKSIQAVADREAEILTKSDASEISSNTKSLEGNNVQDNLNDAGKKLAELELETVGQKIYVKGIGIASYFSVIKNDISLRKDVIYSIKCTAASAENTKYIYLSKDSNASDNYAILHINAGETEANYKFTPNENIDGAMLVLYNVVTEVSIDISSENKVEFSNLLSKDIDFKIYGIKGNAVSTINNFTNIIDDVILHAGEYNLTSSIKNALSSIVYTYLDDYNAIEDSGHIELCHIQPGALSNSVNFTLSETKRVKVRTFCLDSIEVSSIIKEIKFLDSSAVKHGNESQKDINDRTISAIEKFNNAISELYGNDEIITGDSTPGWKTYKSGLVFKKGKTYIIKTDATLAEPNKNIYLCNVDKDISESNIYALLTISANSTTSKITFIPQKDINDAKLVSYGDAGTLTFTIEEFGDVDVLKNNVNELNYTIYGYSTLPSNKGYIDGSNVILIGSGYYGTHKAIPVNGGDVVKVVANDVDGCNMFIVKSYSIPSSTITPAWATGESGVRNVAKSSVLTLTMPADAKYILVNDNSWNDKGSTLPKYIYINNIEVLNGVVDLLKTEETYEVPLYWLDMIEQKSATINRLGESIGSNGDSFIFFTDYHQNTGFGTTPQLVKYICNHTSVNKVISGGDISDGCSSVVDSDSAVAMLRKIHNDFKGVGPIFMRGNHDIEPTANNESMRISDSAYYDICIRPIEHKVVADGKAYFYMDNKSSKIRYIILDTGSTLTERLDRVQLSWMQERLTELEEGWSVIIMQHMAVTGVVGGDITMMPYGTATINAINEVFDTLHCTIVALVVGHVHEDYSVITEKGFPLISTTCDSGGENAAYDRNFPIRTKGTTTESAFDVYTIDKLNRKIYATRIGAGNDRVIDY